MYFLALKLQFGSEGGVKGKRSLPGRLVHLSFNIVPKL